MNRSGTACQRCQPYFESQAVEAVAGRGWEQAGGRAGLCRDCTDWRHCGQHGHDFDPWAPCLCGGRVSTDSKHPDGFLRRGAALVRPDAPASDARPARSGRARPPTYGKRRSSCPTRRDGASWC